jgi:hypothetical protein
MEYTDIIGTKIGLLTVNELVGVEKIHYTSRTRMKPSTRFRYSYKCFCECGNQKVVERSNLVGEKPHTASCGCLKQRTMSESKTWTGHGDISGRLWYSISVKAAERELPFNITIEQAWNLFQSQQERCALSGLPLSLKETKGKYKKRTASLDRIDNTRGYEPDNVQWVHKDINWMKGRYRQDYFLELCKKVASHVA